MKKTNILIILFICFTFIACDGYFRDFLEKAPGVDVTEDTIFSTKEQVETFVAGSYFWGAQSYLAHWDDRDKSDCQNDAGTDAGEIAMTWYWTQSLNSASQTPDWTLDFRFNTYWLTIRRANILLERIDKAPFNDPEYKKQVKGEAKFLRAYNYFQLFRNYGGVPIVEKRFALSDDLALPRNTVEEVVNFIVQDCNDAFDDLPYTYPSTLRGRATKVAAAALKSRTLLYAASETYNTATPYLDLGANNKMIIYGNFDNNRWKLAADAAKQALDALPYSEFQLVTDQGVDKNYQYVWEIPDNTEIILAEKSKNNRVMQHFPWGPIIPQTVGGFGGGLNLTFNYLKFYQKIDGTEQQWNMSGGSDLLKKLNELDPRFKQTYTYQGQPWNEENPIMDFTETGRDKCITGVLVHKPVPYSMTRNRGAIPNGIIFRVGELYLNYAEALNEFNTIPPQEAYDAVNIIRTRSGMPEFPKNLTKEQFREKVRNERNIELAFEGHRFYDIRRWQIAENEGIMKGSMYGLKIYRITNSTEFRYEPYVFETRSYKTQMYRHPFSQYEINKGYLIQNPGW